MCMIHTALINMNAEPYTDKHKSHQDDQELDDTAISYALRMDDDSIKCVLFM